MGREAEMDTQSQVLTTEMEFEGRSYHAAYFLERDIIQVNIEGTLFTTASAGQPAENVVRALLLEWLLENARRDLPE